jgi:hypothetical protein
MVEINVQIENKSEGWNFNFHRLCCEILNGIKWTKNEILFANQQCLCEKLPPLSAAEDFE